MSDRRPPFDPAELRGMDDPKPTDADLAGALGAARALEGAAARATVRPTDGFEDRVMAAIATEAVPKVVVRPAEAVRGGRPAAFLVAIRDAWGVARSGGRPLAVRAQAMGFVLLVLLATVSVSAFAVAGAAGLLASPSATPASSPPPGPSSEPSVIAPTTTPSLVPPASDDPSASPEPTDEASPSTSPSASDEASEHPSSSSGSSKTPKPTATPRPTKTPDKTEDPDETDEPDETPEPAESDDSHGGSEDRSGSG